MAVGVIDIPRDGTHGRGFEGTEDSLWNEVQSHVSPHEILTRAKAFEVFERVEWECRAKAFLSKPLVAIPLTFTAMVIGFPMMEAASAIIVIAGTFLAIGGAITFIFSLMAAADGELFRISRLYGDISREAKALKNSLLDRPNAQVRFQQQGE